MLHNVFVPNLLYQTEKLSILMQSEVESGGLKLHSSMIASWNVVKDAAVAGKFTYSVMRMILAPNHLPQELSFHSNDSSGKQCRVRDLVETIRRFMNYYSYGGYHISVKVSDACWAAVVDTELQLFTIGALRVAVDQIRYADVDPFLASPEDGSKLGTVIGDEETIIRDGTGNVMTADSEMEAEDGGDEFEGTPKEELKKRQTTFTSAQKAYRKRHTSARSDENETKSNETGQNMFDSRDINAREIVIKIDMTDMRDMEEGEEDEEGLPYREEDARNKSTTEHALEILIIDTGRVSLESKARTRIPKYFLKTSVGWLNGSYLCGRVVGSTHNVERNIQRIIVPVKENCPYPFDFRLAYMRTVPVERLLRIGARLGIIEQTRVMTVTGKLRVLIIDPNTKIAAMTAHSLRLSGWECVVANDYAGIAEALRLRDNLGIVSQAGFDTVLLDYAFRKKMIAEEGVDFAILLHAICVIGMVDSMPVGEPSGPFSGFISKPFTSATIAKISGILKSVALGEIFL